MKAFVFVTSIVLFLLLQTVVARAQSNFVDVGWNSVEPVIATTSYLHRYHELSINTSGMVGNPQLMSDLKDQRLFFTGIRQSTLDPKTDTTVVLQPEQVQTGR